VSGFSPVGIQNRLTQIRPNQTEPTEHQSKLIGYFWLATLSRRPLFLKGQLRTTVACSKLLSLPISWSFSSCPELIVSQLRVAKYIVHSDRVKRSVFFFSSRHFRVTLAGGFPQVRGGNIQVCLDHARGVARNLLLFLRYTAGCTSRVGCRSFTLLLGLVGCPKMPSPAVATNAGLERL
jgi:hypothetical protein